MRAVSDGNC